jgi:hypothetical protein
METNQFGNQSTVNIELNINSKDFLFFFGSSLYRKRSITQCIETHRSFQTLYQQEERVLDNLQRRMETLEPVPNDPNKLQQMGKTVTVKIVSISFDSQ